MRRFKAPAAIIVAAYIVATAFISIAACVKGIDGGEDAGYAADAGAR